MELFKHFYLNYLSLSSIIVVIFMAFLAFFYVQVKDKSEPTKWLMIFFVLMVFFYSPYISGAFYHPIFAYHRWATVLFVLLAAVAFNHFLLRFPHMTHPRLTFGVLIVQWLVNISWSIYFCIATYGETTVFNFSAYAWDFDADKISRITGLLIFANMLVGYVLGIWRALILRRIRWVMLAFVFSFILATLVPGVTNVLSRSGTMSREMHQTVISVAVILGFFTLTMVFINTTRDQTTFMAKIIGVSFATFMLMMAPISLITLNDKEASYDRIFLHESHALVKGEKPHPDFRYLAAYDLTENHLGIIKTKGDLKPKLEHSDPDYTATYLYGLLQSYVGNPDLQTAAALKKRLLSDSAFLDSPWSQAYQNLILHINDSLSVAAPDRAKTILAKIDAGYRVMLSFYNKSRVIPPEDFINKAPAHFQAVSQDKITYPLAQKALFLMDAKASHAPQELRKEVLNLLLPMRSPGARHYRYSNQTSQDAFVAYMQVDLEQKRVYEAGFSYLQYRAFIHSLAINLFWIVLAISILVLFGYRVFFSGAMVRPLGSLLDGVREVNQGRLDVHVPIQVEDEIGFLSRSFNSMVTSIREAQIKLKDYAENLEDKVRVRTEELKNSLDKVQALKNQQDGDYFLTSLLTKPLNANSYQGENINVDFLVSQKKKFEFRNRQDELGGDMCSAHQIKLKGRNYLVFMNADAMGKSIQGAGGVLVLGSVFESMIMRTMLSERASNYFPERWLKNAFVELHKVFEAFDGSMLISVAFGLLEEDTGFLYYINAEHPYSVSYYNRKATFMDQDILFRKLGTIGLGRGIHILTHQMRPGEVFIAGSDGRDDILLGHTESGERVINEDEHLFIQHVEQADGHLLEIEKLLLQKGELTDDLSLLRIEFVEPLVQVSNKISKKAYEQIREARRHVQQRNWSDAWQKLTELTERSDQQHPQVMKEKAGVLFKLKRYPDALELVLQYLAQISSDVDVLYLASLLYKRLRKMDEAADYGERVRLRKPAYADNLVNLADVYHHMGQKNRSDKILQEALRYDPDNKQALRLKELLY